MNTVIDDLKLNKTSVPEYKNVNTETIVEIAKILSTNMSLHILNLRFNRIGEERVVEIAKMLPFCMS